MKHDLIKNRVEDLRSVEQPEGITPIEIKFALNTIQGYGPQDALAKAYNDQTTERRLTPTQLSKMANKIKNKAIVKKYMKGLMLELERVGVANGFDLQLFLSAAIFTPIGQIDENHPLCQKKKVTSRTDKDGATTETVDLEMVSKLEAAKILIRMKGLDAPIKIDVNHRVGVMIVPMATNVEDWEKAAMGSQKALMEDAVLID